MDFAALLGLAGSIGVVGFAIAFHGHLPAFLDIPSILIIFGGTITVILTSFSVADVARTTSVTGRALVNATPNFQHLATRLVQLSQKARAETLLKLQTDAARESNPFLRQALSLAVDGAPAETIEKILFQDTVSLMERNDRGLQVLRRGAEVAPAMGLIGTLIGLVQMLSNLSDPTSIGPAMAIAILSTFYGAFISYVLLTPMASKLERTGADDLLSRKLITTAILSLVNRENPRQLELHLNAILPPTQRISLF
ncbi:MAG: flagellar motor protein MotA, partial [Proteobacteria bacterium]|nr:flagellar motor protein MotA [Pseudomonadota bacterium]